MRYLMCSLILTAATARAADPLDFSPFGARLAAVERENANLKKRVADLEARLAPAATPAKTQVCDGDTCRLADCPAGTCAVAGTCGGRAAQTVATPVYGWPAGATYTPPQMQFGAAGTCAGGQCGTSTTAGVRGLFGRRR